MHILFSSKFVGQAVEVVWVNPLVELAVEQSEAVEVAEAKRNPDHPHLLTILIKKWTPT